MARRVRLADNPKNRPTPIVGDGLAHARKPGAPVNCVHAQEARPAARLWWLAQRLMFTCDP